MKNFLIILIVLIAAGCRFNKPFLSIRTEKYIKENSNIHSTTYKYFRISKYGIFGHLQIDKKYDTNGKLTEKSIHKYSAFVRDGVVKSHTKKITLSENGSIIKMELKITKSQGWYKGKTIMDKTILFDDTGKKKQTINNLEN